MSTFLAPKAPIWVQKQQAGNCARFLNCLLSGMSSRTDIPQDPILKARRIWEFHPWLQGPLWMTSEWVWNSLFRGLKSWGQCLVQRQQWNEAEVGLFLVAAPWLFLLLLQSRLFASLLISLEPFSLDHLYLNPLVKVYGGEIRHKTLIILVLLEDLFWCRQGTRERSRKKGIQKGGRKRRVGVFSFFFLFFSESQ